MALQLLSDMPLAKVAVDAVSYNAAISACQKAWNWQAALHLMSEMPASNVVSFSTALSACQKGFQWEQALHLFREMGATRVDRNVASRILQVSTAATVLPVVATVDGQNPA